MPALFKRTHMFIVEHNFNFKLIVVEETNQCNLDCLHFEPFAQFGMIFVLDF